MGRALRAGVAALAFGLPAEAQQAPAAPLAGVPRSAVVVLDRDALFAQSLFGARAQRDIEAASEALVAENSRIEAMLEAEELALTERRVGMEPEAFRALATAFDARVTEIRQAQDAKARAIAQQGERAQQAFLERANPILAELARETGALVILDRRMVIASSDQVDITLLARARIDAVLGEGPAMPATPSPAPASRGDGAAGTPPAP